MDVVEMAPCGSVAGQGLQSDSGKPFMGILALDQNFRPKDDATMTTRRFVLRLGQRQLGEHCSH
jgi:hypothetical protein